MAPHGCTRKVDSLNLKPHFVFITVTSFQVDGVFSEPNNEEWGARRLLTRKPDTEFEQGGLCLETQDDHRRSLHGAKGAEDVGGVVGARQGEPKS